jgi:uncharacterized protein (TIGR02246 family)
MKKSLIVFCSVISLICCPGLRLDLGAAEANREADHAALRQLRDKMATAINNQDVNMMASGFAKQFAFTTVTQTILTNEAQVKSFFDQMFRSPQALVTSMKTEPKADIPTRFIDDNTGVCYGSTVDTYTLKSGDVVQMTNRWSATVVKEDGQWKVAMAHVGTDFLNNPVLNRVQSSLRNLAFGTGTAGLVIGFILGFAISRRKKSAA